MNQMTKMVLIVVCLTCILTTVAEAKVVFTDASPYYQPFEEGSCGVSADTKINSPGTFPWIDNATIIGWYAVVDGKAATQYGASNSHKRKGDEGIYLFRSNGKNAALGTLRKSTSTGLTAFGVELGNETDSTMTALSISYEGQQWQQNTGGPDQLTLQYSTDATALTTGHWVTVSALSFKSVKDSGSDDYVGFPTRGKVLIDKISGKISGLNIESGQSVWLRWVDDNNAGVDQALAIDSLKITPKLSK